MCRFCIEGNLHHKVVIDGLVEQRPQKPKSKKKTLNWLIVYLERLELWRGKTDIQRQHIKEKGQRYKIYGEYKSEEAAKQATDTDLVQRISRSTTFMIITRDAWNEKFKHYVVYK